MLIKELIKYDKMKEFKEQLKLEKFEFSIEPTSLDFSIFFIHVKFQEDCDLIYKILKSIGVES